MYSIQYPSLDDTRLAIRTGEQMIAPATMLREIQSTTHLH